MEGISIRDVAEKLASEGKFNWSDISRTIAGLEGEDFTYRFKFRMGPAGVNNIYVYYSDSIPVIKQRGIILPCRTVEEMNRNVREVLANG